MYERLKMNTRFILSFFFVCIDFRRYCIIILCRLRYCAFQNSSCRKSKHIERGQNNQLKEKERMKSHAFPLYWLQQRFLIQIKLLHLILLPNTFPGEKKSCLSLQLFDIRSNANTPFFPMVVIRVKYICHLNSVNNALSKNFYLPFVNGFRSNICDKINTIFTYQIGSNVQQPNRINSLDQTQHESKLQLLCEVALCRFSK